jgi:putative phosphoesterase
MITPRLTKNHPFVVGILSDTHGHLPDGAMTVLSNVHQILHAGDIGSPDILSALEKTAPTIAVRGNMDGGEWADHLPEEKTVRLGNISVHILHDLDRIKTHLGNTGVHVVVSGHTHRPRVEKQNSRLYINPGSTSYPRGRYPASLAILKMFQSDLSVEIVNV